MFFSALHGKNILIKVMINKYILTESLFLLFFIVVIP